MLPHDDLMRPYDDLMAPHDDQMLSHDDLRLPYDDQILSHDDLIVKDLICPTCAYILARAHARLFQGLQRLLVS